MEQQEILSGALTISVVSGSVIDQDVDAIVNAANSAMRGGGGIDGAIHSKAGKGLMEELCKVAPNGCRAGKVVVTGGHRLPHKHIIHASGPFYQGGKNGEPEKLRNCYLNALQSASELNLTSIGFCSISTGIYGYPLKEAATIALGAVLEFGRTHPETTLRRAVFAMYGTAEFEVFSRVLGDAQRSQSEARTS